MATLSLLPLLLTEPLFYHAQLFTLHHQIVIVNNLHNSHVHACTFTAICQKSVEVCGNSPHTWWVDVNDIKVC